MQGDLTNAVPPPGTGAPLPIDGGVYLLRPSSGAGSLLEEVRKAIAVAGDAPVVVVTPAWDQETVSLALRAGAEDCLEESELHDPSTLRRLSTAVVRHRIRTGAVGESRRLWDHLARDIEGQPAASGALRASGQQLRAILENEPEGVLTVAADGTIIAVNHSGARLLEVEDPAALAGRSIRDLIHPEDREAFENLQCEVLQGKAGKLRFRVIGILGTERWLDATSAPLYDESDGSVAALTVARDVTDRMAAEESAASSRDRLRQILESNLIGIVFWKVDGSFTEANRAFLEMLGYTQEDLAAGLRWQDITPSEYAEVDELALHEVLSTGEGRPFEKEYLRKDGTRIPILLGSRLWEDSKDSGFSFVIDITQRRQLQQQLLQAQKMDALGRLAGGVAHDFNNLLTVINGYGNIALQQLSADNPATDKVREVCRAGERAASLTRQLLSFSRRQTDEQQVVNLNQVVEESQRMLARLIGEHIELETRLAANLGNVCGDPGQLSQLILNLSLNARDAMPKGGKLTIVTERQRLERTANSSFRLRPGPYALLSVRDTGVGMSSEVQERLFEPFFTTKPAGQGTGLGMATVYGIVQQSRGQIIVTSAPDRGTVVDVYLPLTAKETRTAEQAVTADLRGSETVLLAEDEDSVRALLTQILQESGYSVYVAADGEEALQLYEELEGRIDLLISDVVMPRMGGVELAEHLRVLTPELPVLFVTGYAEEATLRRGLKAPRSHLLQKPFEPDGLLHMLKGILSQNREN